MSGGWREEAGIVFFPDEEPLLSNIHTVTRNSLMAGYSHKKRFFLFFSQVREIEKYTQTLKSPLKKR